MSAVPQDSPMVANLRARGLLDIVERYAAKHHVTVKDVLGRGRSSAVAAARHAVWRELRETTSMSLPEIGALFDRNDATVFYALYRRGKSHPAAVARAAMRVV